MQRLLVIGVMVVFWGLIIIGIMRQMPANPLPNTAVPTLAAALESALLRPSPPVTPTLPPALTVSPAVPLLWADKTVCPPHETPITCEIRLHNPAILLIRLGSNDAGVPDSFDQNVRQLVALERGHGVHNLTALMLLHALLTIVMTP